MPFIIISGVPAGDHRYVRDMLQVLFADTLGLKHEQTTVQFLEYDTFGLAGQRVVAQVSSKIFATAEQSVLNELAEGIVGSLEMTGSEFNEVLFTAAIHVLARPNLTTKE